MKPIALILTLTGCGLLDHGSDTSNLHIKHNCDVSLEQAAATHGDEQAKVVESVKINPDCTTEIDFKQNVGD